MSKFYLSLVERSYARLPTNDYKSVPVLFARGVTGGLGAPDRLRVPNRRFRTLLVERSPDAPQLLTRLSPAPPIAALPFGLGLPM